MTKFYIGTAGWSYLKWDKEFYPAGRKPANKLAYYATRFNAVELNNSFYHTPSADQFVEWERHVSSSFQLAIKAPRYITHVKKLKDVAETLPPFLDALSLCKKSGPIFFQLAPNFPLNLERLAALLQQLPKKQRSAIELRDPTWHCAEVYALLRKYNVAFCLYDTIDLVSPRELTADFAYLRLRGRSEQGLKSFLKEWRKWLSAHTKEAYVFFDNHEEKSLAFGNALEFQALVEANTA